MTPAIPAPPVPPAVTDLDRPGDDPVTSERIPYGKQISPEQIDLPRLLELAHDNDGDRQAFELSIRHAFFDTRKTSVKNRNTTAMNAFLAMRHYGLIEGGTSSVPFRLTETGQQLHALRGEPAKLLAAFARHILTNLHGLQVLEVIESMRARGQQPTVPGLATELLALGIEPGSASGENLNPFLMWLRRAGVLKGWNIDDPTLQSLIGATSGQITELAALPLAHQAILLALATMSGSPPYNAAMVRRLAETQTPSAAFNTKVFAQQVLGRLQEAGWLTVAKATGGRGAKSHAVTPTEQFKRVISEPLAGALVRQTHLQDPVSLRRPLKDLLAVVRSSSSSNHERGLALEGVCIQLVRLIGASFVGWRRRGDETQGAEVDVIAELTGGRYLLVQIQSKASRIASRDIVDREVGVATGLKSNVLLLVSAGDIAAAARRAAATHMQESGIAILFLDGRDLERIESGAEISGLLDREWQAVTAVRSPRIRKRVAAL